MRLSNAIAPEQPFSVTFYQSIPSAYVGCEYITAIGTGIAKLRVESSVDVNLDQLILSGKKYDEVKVEQGWGPHALPTIRGEFDSVLDMKDNLYRLEEVGNAYGYDNPPGSQISAWLNSDVLPVDRETICPTANGIVSTIGTDPLEYIERVMNLPTFKLRFAATAGKLLRFTDVHGARSSRLTVNYSNLIGPASLSRMKLAGKLRMLCEHAHKSN
ncbi:hypothetical protein I302_106995 [Kwoniella bestiolae CBS 10118]|uniref:Uncharacterized protein n=1 Tax=Kwoniella bestiolae CBS 10118 TaxID=1296100 RepID=A0AAJ8MBT8_9TREE